MQNRSRELSSQMGMVKAVIAWCDATQGRRPLRRGLTALLEAFDASVIVLSRVSPHQNGKSDLIEATSRSFQRRSPEIKSFAHDVLGAYADKAKLGSVWSSAAHLSENDSPLQLFQHRKGLRELDIIPLATGNKHLDFLEIHYGHPVPLSQKHALEDLAVSLSDTWAARKPGVFTAALPKARSVQSRAAKTPAAPILSFENPAGLSKAEYRVCASLNRGLTTNELCGELHISKATLRTHLRNIYAKTNAESMPQLLFALVSSAPYENDYRAAG